jgi:predicted RNase H-like HicB family nuclease
MGCTYPQEVMKQLKELWKDIGEDDISDITKLPMKHQDFVYDRHAQ